MSKCRERRRALGLSQQQIAERVGITRQHYGYIENSHRIPSMPIAIAIARILNTTVEDLFGECDSATREHA